MTDSKKFFLPINLTQNEIQNATIHRLAAAPSSPQLGQIYFNTTSNVLSIYNGTVFRPADAAALSDGSIQIAALAVNPLARSNHTGMQASATISDLKSTVTSYTLDQFAAAVAPVNMGGQRLTNIAQATSNTDSARWDQVIAYVTGAIQGQTSLKVPVRVYADGSGLTLSGLQVIDGVQLVANDRVAVGGMGTSNAIYLAATGAWVLAADSLNGSQWIEGTEFLVTEGTTYTGAVFRQTTAGSIVLGTTPLVFTQSFKINVLVGDGSTTSITGNIVSVKFGAGLTTASGSLAVDTSSIQRKYSTSIVGDGSTTVFAINHNLNNSNVNVVVRDSNGVRVELDDVPASSNTLNLGFAYAPSQGTTYTVAVAG